MTIDSSKIGIEGSRCDFVVSKENIIDYAKATNDDIKDHIEGNIASPVFSVVPMWEALMDTVTGMVDEADIFSIVHGEQDMFFYSDILPNDELESVVTPIGLSVKPSGSVLTLLTSTSTKSGELRNKQVVSFFFRGISEGESVGHSAPAHKFIASYRKLDTLDTIDIDIAKDQTFAYAKASRDNMPIHLDDDFAKSVGLPGIIVHGLCTMAMASVSVFKAINNSQDYNGLKLSRLAVRFSRFVIPGDTITTICQDNLDVDDQRATIENFLESLSSKKTVVFETVNSQNQAVLKDGRAEFI